MKKIILFLQSLTLILIFFYPYLTIYSQEYPTDRLFIKQLKKTKCLRMIEERINSLKIKREMTLEHELLLNKNIWNKIRTNLPLSTGEMKRLRYLKKNDISSKKLTSKKLWAKKEKEFKALRSMCN